MKWQIKSQSGFSPKKLREIIAFQHLVAVYGAVGSIRAQSPARYLGTCLLLDSCTDLCLPSDFQLCWMPAGPWLSDALCKWPLCWKWNLQHLSLQFHWIKNASLIGCIFLLFPFYSKLDHEQILFASFGLQLLPSQCSEAALSCTGPCQQMLPKHLAARVNVLCLAMWSDSVKIAPSSSTNLPPVCLQVTPSSSPDKNKCLVLSAQLMQLGEGSCSLLCFKQQQQSSGWGTSCWVWRQRRSVCFWVLRWHCRETEKKQAFGWWPGKPTWKSKFQQHCACKLRQNVCSSRVRGCCNGAGYWKWNPWVCSILSRLFTKS